MPLLINGVAIGALVTADGLPRAVNADDGSQHVMYLNGGPAPQSMLASAWIATRGPLPLDPTPQQSSAAISARDAAKAAQAAKRVARQTRARSGLAIGVDVGALTTPQLLILVKAMADKLGAFDDDGLLLPVEQWGQA